MSQPGDLTVPQPIIPEKKIERTTRNWLRLRVINSEGFFEMDNG
jgi:hypothetical protein